MDQKKHRRSLVLPLETHHPHSDDMIVSLAKQVVSLMSQLGLTVTTAESCSGGWIAKALTDIAGSSAVLEGGVVSYSNHCKEKVLGVAKRSLENYGAVSEDVVIEMSAGVKSLIGSDISVAVSGIAGPGGGVENKPVGTVWIAWNDGEVYSQCFHFEGDRDAVRRLTVTTALKGILELLPNK